MIGLGFGGANFFRHDGSLDIDNEYMLDICVVYIRRRAVNPSLQEPSRVLTNQGESNDAAANFDLYT